MQLGEHRSPSCHWSTGCKVMTETPPHRPRRRLFVQDLAFYLTLSRRYITEEFHRCKHSTRARYASGHEGRNRSRSPTVLDGSPVRSISTVRRPTVRRPPALTAVRGPPFPTVVL